MEVSKIHLSSSEMELMQNAEIILTKNRVLEKIKGLLETVQEKQTGFIENSNFDDAIFIVSPKISKGENYLGFPYLILDYPRQFSGDHFFFIRTMFWWGKFFSCTLHLANESKELFGERIQEAHSRLKNHYISISNDQWVHHLEESDYKQIGLMTEEQFRESCTRFDHIKIACRHPLTEWEKITDKLYEDWKFFLSLCGLIT